MSPKNKTRRGPLPGGEQKGGWNDKSKKMLPEEKLKQGFWSVKTKYFSIVQKQINELTSKYK